MQYVYYAVCCYVVAMFCIMPLIAMSDGCYAMKLVAMSTHPNLARCLGCYGNEVTGCYVRWTVVVVHVITTSPPHSIAAFCNQQNTFKRL